MFTGRFALPEEVDLPRSQLYLEVDTRPRSTETVEEYQARFAAELNRNRDCLRIRLNHIRGSFFPAAVAALKAERPRAKILIVQDCNLAGNMQSLVDACCALPELVGFGLHFNHPSTEVDEIDLVNGLRRILDLKRLRLFGVDSWDLTYTRDPTAVETVATGIADIVIASRTIKHLAWLVAPSGVHLASVHPWLDQLVRILDHNKSITSLSACAWYTLPQLLIKNRLVQAVKNNLAIVSVDIPDTCVRRTIYTLGGNHVLHAIDINELHEALDEHRRIKLRLAVPRAFAKINFVEALFPLIADYALVTHDQELRDDSKREARLESEAIRHRYGKRGASSIGLIEESGTKRY